MNWSRYEKNCAAWVSRTTTDKRQMRLIKPWPIESHEGSVRRALVEL